MINPRTVTIYSVGLLGGSLGLALKASGFAGRIVGLSSDASIATALRLGCIDEGYSYDELPRVVGRTEVLVLCSPLSVIMSTLRTLGSLDLPDGLLITDVGSTKSLVVATAREALPGHVRFVGGHPMAGSEKSGAAAADPYLFQNAIYVLVPHETAPSPHERAFAAFLEKYLGCRHLFLDSEVHDRIAATVSHVPHLLAVALVELAQAGDETRPGTLQLAAGGFRDMTRIASAPYRMWHDILETNKAAIGAALDEFAAILTTMRDRLEGGALESAFRAAAVARTRIPARDKGFLTALSEILVVAKDQPGVIARLSAVLAGAGINIKDIEVMKVREGEGGTIRLAFESSAIAGTAIALLNDAGFSARER